MFEKLQARIKDVVERYAGDEASTVAGSTRGAGRAEQASYFLLWSIAALFLALFIWITFAEVDTVSRADGRIIPSAKMQVIQNLEGGIVSDIFVKQGERVDAGARLVSLSSVQHGADMQARFHQVLALEAREARLLAQANGGRPAFGARVRESGQEQMNSEMATFLSKKAEQESQIGVLDAQLAQKNREYDEASISLQAARRGLALAREERETVAKMVERGLEPRLELVRIDRSVAELQGRAEVAEVAMTRLKSAIAEIESRRSAVMRQFRSEALAELSRTVADLNPLRESLPALQDKLRRTEIAAPMKGIVNRVFVTTRGGVVKPGDPILEVVPADDQLVVEALVRPQDIGFVKVGQAARIKITAYDFSIFGAMDGTVANISADAVPNEKGEAFYQVRIETRTTAIEALDKKLPIIPGMQAQIDIITGKKTILKFLSKPLVAVKENAFRER